MCFLTRNKVSFFLLFLSYRVLRGLTPPPSPPRWSGQSAVFSCFEGNLECRSVLPGLGSWEGGGESLKETRNFVKRFDKEIEAGGCRRSAVEKRWLKTRVSRRFS